jgi:elongation factor 1-gamma
MAKLYTTKGNVNGFKAMVAALYNGVPLQVPDNFDVTKHASDPAYLALSPMGEVPCLETACGAAICQPDAILRFVMRANLASQLYGRSAVEQGQIDQFIEFAKTKLEAPLNAWTYPIHGLCKYNHQVVEQAMKDVPVALQYLEAHLATRTFLVGQCVTGADIACSLAMLDAATVVFDGKFREPFPNVFRWFMTCVNQPQFAAVIGEVALCTEAKSAKPAKAAKPAKEKKPQQPKQEKKKKEKKPDPEEEEPAAAPPAAKRVNPLESLPKSAFILDEWKRQYSNNDFPVAADWLWKNFDAEGYCWYFAKYQFPMDFSKLFNANNLLNGYIQRLDSLRKWGFASFCICGDASSPPWNIYGIFLFRGQEIPFECYDCPDSEVYDFEKCDPSNPEHKLKMECLMAAEGEWFNQGPEYECQTWKCFK